MHPESIESTMPELVSVFLSRTLIERSRPLVVKCDLKWQPLMLIGEPTYFGFAPDALDALELARSLFVGFAEDEIASLRFVDLSTRSAHVHFLPDGDARYVVFLDASEETERHREIQQAGNQAELENIERQRAMQRLRAARNELENQRKQLEEANAIKAAFIATLSHEFRTPLTSVFGYLHILERKPQNDPDVTQALRAIHRGALHLFGLAENLLEFGRGENGTIQLNPVSIDLFELANDLSVMFRPLAQTQQLELQVEVIENNNTVLMLDEIKLKQVLINLLSNAVRYTQVGSVRAQLFWNGQEFRAEVVDTGIGIPIDKQESVFQPFNRGGHQGSKGAGLGLSIVKRLVENMHGSIEMQSKLGSGTSFTLKLPPLKIANEKKPELHIAPPQISAGETNLFTAMVADDDPDIRDLLKMLLEDLGYQVMLASNAQEAFDLAMHKQPDLVLIDVQMPGASGNTAVYRLRSHGFTRRIVTLSANPNNEAREASIAAGANLYLTKPINLEQFARALKPQA